MKKPIFDPVAQIILKNEVHNSFRVLDADSDVILDFWKIPKNMELYGFYWNIFFSGHLKEFRIFLFRLPGSENRIFQSGVRIEK